jgi:thiol-disulfide isomerase/thioredoxin
MKAPKILAMFFVLSYFNVNSQIYYPAPDNYDENDPKTHLYDDGKGNTITWDQLPKYKQDIQLIIYSPYKPLSPAILNKIGFTKQPTILYFYSPYCGACKPITPEIEKLKNSKVKVIMMNNEGANTELLGFFKKHIQYLPTIWFIKPDGTYKQYIGGDKSGSRTIPKIKNFVKGIY